MTLCLTNSYAKYLLIVSKETKIEKQRRITLEYLSKFMGALVNDYNETLDGFRKTIWYNELLYTKRPAGFNKQALFFNHSEAKARELLNSSSPEYPNFFLYDYTIDRYMFYVYPQARDSIRPRLLSCNEFFQYAIQLEIPYA